MRYSYHLAYGFAWRIMMNYESTLYSIIRQGINTASMLMFRLDVHYHEALPAGAKIIAPNHPTTTDPFLLLSLTQEHISILIERKIFQVPFWGKIMLKGGQIPVDKQNGRVAFEAGLSRLKAGEAIAVYPEGHVSPHEGGFCEPKTGVVRLALMTGAPIIPIGIYVDRSLIRIVDTKIKDNEEVATWYFKGPYAMTVGSPILLDGNIEDREYVREASRQLMQRITQLTHESAYRAASPTEARAFVNGKLANAIGSMFE